MTADLFDAPEATVSTPAGDWYVAHCDGGSRGNPGPSGYGAVIENSQGQVQAELSEFLGVRTNNFAEYSGLLAVLRWALEHKIGRLRVVSDSELMVKQMQGKYKVASPALRPLWEEAKKLSRRLEEFEICHTLRAGNKTADRLANEAMDRGQKSGNKPGNRPGNKAPGGGGQPSERQPGKQPYYALRSTTPSPLPRPAAESQSNSKPGRQVLEGYVKGGVVHLLEGELPDGIFVKIVRE